MRPCSVLHQQHCWQPSYLVQQAVAPYTNTQVAVRLLNDKHVKPNGRKLSASGHTADALQIVCWYMGMLSECRKL